jgi:hypothetical protein
MVEMPTWTERHGPRLTVSRDHLSVSDIAATGIAPVSL